MNGQPSLRELYAYWKTPAAGQALQAARAAQAELRHRLAGLLTELLLRESTDDALSTVMEIYRHEAGVDAGMQAEIDLLMRSALKSWLASPRHVEAFVNAGVATPLKPAP